MSDFKVIVAVWLSLLLGCASIPASANSSATQEGGRAWTIRDSIATTYYVVDIEHAQTLEPVTGDPVSLSPDGKYALFVARRGYLGCDCDIFELNIYSTDEIENALFGRITDLDLISKVLKVRVKSRSTIAIRWAEDSSGIIVHKSGSGGGDPNNLQVFRINPVSGAIEAITNAPNGVGLFSIGGESVVYTSVAKQKPLEKFNKYPAVDLKAADLVWMLTSRSPQEISYGLFSSNSGGEQKLIELVDPSTVRGLWVSPSGLSSIIAMPSQRSIVPSGWINYDGMPVGDEGQLVDVPQFLLVDLKDANYKSAISAPTGLVTKMGKAAALRGVKPNVLWSSDGQYAVLINTALPLDNKNTERENTAYIATTEVGTGRWQELQPLERTGRRVTKVSWVIPGKSLAVVEETSAGEPLGEIIYTLKNGRFGSREASKVAANESANAAGSVNHKNKIIFRIRESANDPPVVIASLGIREVALTTIDPKLGDIWRAQAMSVQWREADGRAARGLLMMPRNYTGRRPALVIQAYRYLPDVFRPDGAYTTAYAAQALVSKGMAVLQVDIPSIDKPELANTPREGPAFVERIDAAVKKLANKDLIDPSRVGLVGFSRGGYMTYYAITHPGSVRIAAAINADGFTGGYSEYLLRAVSGGRRPDPLEKMYGGGTFWERENAWLSHSPGFNVDQVRTPLLFTVNSSKPELQLFETAGAFMINGLPFAAINFPGGMHPMLHPRQRFESMVATVDWMSFWLLGIEDPNEAKRERYALWRDLRDQQEGME